MGAARRRKAAAAAVPMRKGAAAPMRKAQDGARVSIVLEQSSSGQLASPPPRAFTDGNCFFNGNGGGFFSNVGRWDSQSSDPATWGNNAIPPGGFTNYIQPNFSEQFNFVGEHSQPEEFSTPISARDNTYVSVDSGDEAPRTEKRVFWTQEEDVRMMSSWLLNSTDSTIGADRKNDQYWTDVEAFTMRLHQVIGEEMPSKSRTGFIR